MKLSSTIKSGYHALAIDERRWPFRPTPWELSSKHDPGNFEEKWFKGVHSDVGGGYAECGLSDQTLSWMAEKAVLHGLNVNLDLGLDAKNLPEPLAQHNSQNWRYRLMTLLTVKLPSCIGMIFPKQNTPLVSNIDLRGDYFRPRE